MKLEKSGVLPFGDNPQLKIICYLYRKSDSDM